MNALAHPRLTPSLAVATLILLPGCTAGMNTSVEEALAPAAPISPDRLAIMPITTDAGSEGIRAGLARDLRQELERRFPELVIIGPEETAERLASSSAATAYGGLLADYEKTGVVASERLARLTSHLDSDHLLQLRASFAREEFLAASIADQVATENRQDLVVVVRLWSDRGPSPVWEAVLRTHSETDFLYPRSPGVNELISDLVGLIGERIPVSGP